jgi:hypothetical protein
LSENGADFAQALILGWLQRADERHSDNKSPFNEDEMPGGELYLADLGFFSLGR